PRLEYRRRQRPTQRMAATQGQTRQDAKKLCSAWNHPPDDSRGENVDALCGALAGWRWRILGFIVAAATPAPRLPLCGGLAYNLTGMAGVGPPRSQPGSWKCPRPSTSSMLPISICWAAASLSFTAAPRWPTSRSFAARPQNVTGWL